MAFAIAKRPIACLIQRIWPKVQDCPVKEVCMPQPCSATKVNTKDNTGSYVSE